MTSNADIATGTSTASVPSVTRGWSGVAITAIVLVHAAKYPAMRHFIEANLHEGPDTDHLSPEMLAVSLNVGTVLGLSLSATISLLVFGMIRKHSARFTTVGGAPKPLPQWLYGVAVVGLVVPDLISAATGVISVTSTVYHFAIYLPVAAVAIVASPSPRDRRLRLVDVILIVALPFV